MCYKHQTKELNETNSMMCFMFNVVTFENFLLAGVFWQLFPTDPAQSDKNSTPTEKTQQNCWIIQSNDSLSLVPAERSDI